MYYELQNLSWIASDISSDLMRPCKLIITSLKSAPHCIVTMYMIPYEVLVRAWKSE
jgi:hypothetical protein